MLFPASQWDGVADGSITVAFRRWKRPTVRPGGTLQSPSGLLAIDEVAAISEEEITDEDAQRAGFRSRDGVLAALRPDGVLHRVRFHRIGDDPRIALRRRDVLDPEELDALRAALGRLPWAMATLRLIQAAPAVVSTDLAADARVERTVFKQRVRRLKALGLTESLEVGYRLSPRGAAVLRALEPPESQSPSP